MPKKIKKVPVGSLTSVLNFFAEAGLLKRVKRSGWWVAGIKDPESVAEHSFRTAVMGFCMAYLEGVDPFKVMAMTLFNDIHEARINDLHKMGHYYIDFKNAEKKVFQDQVRRLPQQVKNSLEPLRREYDAQQTAESILARDADILECLVQAQEYYQDGHERAKYFLTRAPQYLKSRTAKKMWRDMQGWDTDAWWRQVVKFER